MLSEISKNNEREDIALIVCLEAQAGCVVPHILPLHILGLSTGIPIEVLVYVCSLDTYSGQAPLTVQVETPRLLPGEDIVAVKILATVDAALQDVYLSYARVALV